MSDQITIPKRFCGPPKSGNGGYVCGLLAGYVDGDAEITLRLPPPLERPLDVVREDGVARLMDGDKLVAEATAAEFEVDVPDALSWDDAAAGAKRGHDNRADEQYNSCFVCGLDRGPGDGLCIFPGPIIEGSREILRGFSGHLRLHSLEGDGESAKVAEKNRPPSHAFDADVLPRDCIGLCYVSSGTGDEK